MERLRSGSPAFGVYLDTFFSELILTMTGSKRSKQAVDVHRCCLETVILLKVYVIRFRAYAIRVILKQG